MGERTKIQWCATVSKDGTLHCGYTFNYWEGCTAISPGCANCYAQARNQRFHGGRNWGPGAPRRLSAEAYRRQPSKWDAHAEQIGVRLKVFGGSLMDWADNEIPEAWRADLWRIVRETPYLDWLMLTKRIGNARTMLPPDWGAGYANVWLGATVVTQEEAERDLPRLLDLPAALRWISLEPMLGPIDLTRIEGVGQGRLDWVVIGGDSGRDARPFKLDAAREVIAQCRALGIAVFVKQLGARPVPSDLDMHTVYRNHARRRADDESGAARVILRDAKGGDPDEWPEGLRVREYPSASA